MTPPSWLVPFDPTQYRTLSTAEVETTRQAAWPPSDEILMALGMAPHANVEWYRSVAGLRPPTEWHVTGALDVVPHIRLESPTRQTSFAQQVLHGEIHAVDHVWCPDMLRNLRTFMHQDAFWCQRKPDALIRAFGGPYVLGQQRDKLQLVHGAEHTVLTQQLVVAHNLIYTLIHLVPPVEPGFNTLIFGLNLRGPGFHYHQDALPGLAAKNAPLVPRQPVVTSIFYESPTQDNGKELVLWKPIHNFVPIVSTTHKDTSDEGNTTTTLGNHQTQPCRRKRNADAYHAARALQTTHGMVHVQRAGLQAKAVHGIFHTPDMSLRGGYRVAITARITHAAANDAVRPYLATYIDTFGPHGDTTLPSRPVLYSKDI